MADFTTVAIFLVEGMEVKPNGNSKFQEYYYQQKRRKKKEGNLPKPLASFPFLRTQKKNKNSEIKFHTSDAIKC